MGTWVTHSSEFIELKIYAVPVSAAASVLEELSRVFAITPAVPRDVLAQWSFDSEDAAIYLRPLTIRIGDTEIANCMLTITPLDDNLYTMDLWCALGDIPPQVRAVVPQNVNAQMHTSAVLKALDWTFGLESSGLFYKERNVWTCILDRGSPGGARMDIRGVKIK